MSITVNLKRREPFPSYLRNWTREYNMTGKSYPDTISKFSETTSGSLKLDDLTYPTEITLEFEREEDYVWFVLRWS